MIWKYPINLDKIVTYDPPLPLLEIYPKETVTHFQRETHTKDNYRAVCNFEKSEKMTTPPL